MVAGSVAASQLIEASSHGGTQLRLCLIATIELLRRLLHDIACRGVHTALEPAHLNQTAIQRLS